MMLPPPVRPGDRVGVAALSGAVDSERLQAGLETLRALGFEPVSASNLERRSGLFAGSDDERLQGFHELAADPSLKAIFFARGGYGLLRVLDRIDWVALSKTPRAYIGYSDVSVFLNLVFRRLGLAAFHGPMVAVELADGLLDIERDSLLSALAGDLPLTFELEGVRGPDDVRGPVSGGCLSLLTATTGTPWTVPLAGSIMFWEDVQEPLYRIDRMLTHLKLSGSLARIRGMAVGRIEVADDGSSTVSLDDLLAELSSELGWPVATGCASGHCRPNLTIPLGVDSVLSCSRGRLVVGPSQSSNSSR